jgi:hypothetical protein
VLLEATSRGFRQGPLERVGHKLSHVSARKGGVTHGATPLPKRESTQCPLEKRGALQFAQHS